MLSPPYGKPVRKGTGPTDLEAQDPPEQGNQLSLFTDFLGTDPTYPLFIQMFLPISRGVAPALPQGDR